MTISFKNIIQFSLALAASGGAVLFFSQSAQAVEPEYTADETVVDTLAAAPTELMVVETIAAQEVADSTAADYFAAAPTKIIPTIDRMTRLDMIDYYNAGSETPSKTAFGSNCRIIYNSPEMVVFSTSTVSEYTLAVLPAPKQHNGVILMLARTLRTPAEDTSFKFYTYDWKELEGIMPAVTLDDWILPDARKRKAEIENAVPFVMAVLAYSPAEKILTLTNTTKEYLPEADLPIAESSLYKSIAFRWNGKKFVRIKNLPRQIR